MFLSIPLLLVSGGLDDVFIVVTTPPPIGIKVMPTSFRKEKKIFNAAISK